MKRWMFLAIISVFMPLGIALGLWFNWWSLAVEPSLDDSIRQSVSWIQALIAWLTLIFIATAAFSIWWLKQQISLQREESERNAYRPLISPVMQSAKRFLYCEEIQQKLQTLDKELNENKSYEDEQLQRILKVTRAEFNSIAQNMSFPLVGDIKMSLDHIEALINEYNYLAKRILEKTLRETFATELGVDNFKKVYKYTLPLIDLRCKLSSDYASHFIEYCKRKKSV